MSPFLRLCRDGAIPWRPLDLAAEDARRREVPLLILAGRALGHWSARWAAELGAHPGLGELVAAAFAPAAVDVDRDPATARAIQRALAVSADAAGWPALALALPDGRLVGAFAYAAPAAPGGLPPVAARLVALADAWRDRRGDLEADADRLAALPDDAGPGDLPGEDAAAAAIAAALAAADVVHGGFGPAPRHPLPALLGFLLARTARADAPPALAGQLERTCAAIVAGALHDHLAGGFFRACADAAWSVPAAEKRSRDSLLLALALSAAARRLDGGGAWGEAALRACGWVVGACRREDGAIVHGFHADGPAGAGRWEEGAAYRWTRAQVDEVVGAEGGRILAARFGLDATPRHPAVRAVLPEADARRLPELVARLAAARAGRPAHACDATAFAHDQGLALVALAEAHRRDGQGPWREAALGVWRRIDRDQVPAWDEDGDEAEPAGPRALAWLGRGACAAAALGAEGAWSRARHWAERALAPGEADPDDDEDGPSSAAVLAELCLDLAAAPGIEDAAGWRRAAAGVVARCAGAMQRAPLTCAGLWAARERLAGA